ncbi:triosephosphate isomerase [Candidatus Kaiserbacteria bacterium]|nr:triosephosphate isomerase [Candidatus Kaiserbacteria bacterium]
MKALIVANWKMQPATFREARALFDATKKAADAARGVQVIVAPPAIFLRELSKGYRGRITFAVQNAHSATDTAHTGEISFAQARDARATYALVGHAERRHPPTGGGEIDEEVRKKVAAALAADIIPILCVGEVERTGSGEHFNFVKEQLRVGLKDVSPSNLKRVIITYEPLWTIGQPRPMDAREMHEMAIFIRKSIVESYGQAGMDIKILYGGSINEATAPDMLKNGDVKGLLVGRASADGSHVTRLLASIANA